MHSDRATSPMPAFDLRCRDAEWIDRPQTLDDFGRATELPASVRNAGLGEALVADLVARSHYEIDDLARGRTIVSCQMPRYGIPVGVRELDRPPTHDWNMRAELDGDLIDLDTSGRPAFSVGMQVRRGLIAVAGALPLLVSATPAFANPLVNVEGAAQVQVEQARDDDQPPSLPKDKQAAPAEGEGAAPAEGPASTDATAAPTTAAPAADPPPPSQTDPASRASGNSLSLNGMVVWEGLLGKIVRLELKDGKSLAGTIVAQSNGDLAVARSSDGMIVAVPKGQVAAVRMRPQTAAGSAPGGSGMPIADRPREDGRGLTGGGIVMISLGSIAALSGTVFLAISPSYVFISLPLLLPGLAMIGGGAAMLGAAKKKRRAFNKAWGIPTSRVQMTPTLRASRQGGQVGLVLRF